MKKSTPLSLFKLYDGTLIYSRTFKEVDGGWALKNGRQITPGQPVFSLQDSFLHQDAVQLLIKCHYGGKYVKS